MVIGFDHKLRNLPAPNWEEKVGFSILYALHAIAVICTTGPLKAILKRPRPENPKDSSDPLKKETARFFNLRGHEHNKSMPSGDTAQSAAYASFICFYLPGIFALLGGNFLRIRLICTVALARVFFHCHYIGDTIFGAFVGTVITYLLNYIDI